MSCRIGPNAEVEQGAVRGQPSQSFEEDNIFFEQGKHLMHNPYIGFTLEYLHYVYDCAFTCRSLMETSYITDPLTRYLVYPHDGCRTIEWLCLVKCVTDRSRVVDSQSWEDPFS
jgi:hypothetical protein